MSFWNAERVTYLKKLWTDGLSASQCADRIGGCSRNAVISKIHRLGMLGRAQDINRSRQGPSLRLNALRKTRAANSNKPIAPGAAAFNAPRMPTVEAEPYESSYKEIDVPMADRKSLIDLEKDDCRWPIGDPRDAGFHFCNGKKVMGKPYCEHHINVAYQPIIPSSRRRSNAHVHYAAKRETEDA